MADNMRVMIELAADARKLTAGMKQGESSLHSFASKARSSADSVRNAFATLGITISATAALWKSAQMDRDLAKIGQTAGATGKQVEALRSDLFRLGKESGQSIDSLKQGFDVLVQSGLNMKEARATLEGVNTAMAVTGANAQILATGLTTAASLFNFDLSQQGKALELLDKMTVAGRLGKLELNKLADVFSRVGVNAKLSGMDFEGTLAFIEALSMAQPQADKLATLADSTLRLFTNVKYMEKAQEATGVKFFSGGNRRDTREILEDMKRLYQLQNTEEKKSAWVGAAFGEMDQETRTGLMTFFDGKYLNNISQFKKITQEAGGTLKRDMSEATRNLIDQTGRLRAALLQAADNFVQPINKTLADLIRWGMNSKQAGGAGLSGGQLIGGGVALGGLALVARKYGGKALGALGGTAMGIAGGKAVQAATGVTPVFVTNWPGGSGLAEVGGAAAVGAAGRTALGGLAKLAPLAMRVLPIAAAALVSPAGIAVGGAAAAIGVAMMIKKVLQEREKPKNEINLSVRVDQAGPVVSQSNDMNTSLDVKLWRGGF